MNQPAESIYNELRKAAQPNSAVNAMRVLQGEFDGAAATLGVQSEDDVAALFDERGISSAISVESATRLERDAVGFGHA